MKEDSLELLIGLKVIGEMAAISLRLWTGRSDMSRMIGGEFVRKADRLSMIIESNNAEHPARCPVKEK